MMIPKFFIRLKENRITRKRFVLSLIFLAIIWLVMLSDHGIMKRFTLESNKKQLIISIETERSNKDSLLKIIKKLNTDTLEIERIAREKYGMIKPGEEIFQISKKPKD